MYNNIAVKISQTKTYNINDFLPIYVSDINFENYFTTKQFKNNQRNIKILKYILSKIEKYKYNNDISIESENYTIEHILPENPNDDWNNYFNNDEYLRCINRIGNITLLEKKQNREIGNLSYENKKEIFCNSNSKLTKIIPNHYNEWTEATINDRQKELAKDAKSIWRIQF